MRLNKTEFYSKKERNFFKKHSQLLPKYKEILRRLQNNPFDVSLKTHKLKGELSNFHACSLNYTYRIVFVILIQDNEITLLDIGTHDEVKPGRMGKWPYRLPTHAMTWLLIGMLCAPCAGWIVIFFFEIV